MLALNTVAAGVAMPGWLDLLARMLPDDWRGRFFGLAAALGGVLGVGGGAAAAALLGRFGWITGTALCFACAAACLAVSFLCLALGREPASASAVRPQRHDAPALRRWGRLLRDDRSLRWYLTALALLTSAGAAAAFYTVDARRTLGLTDAAASRYAIVLLAATTAGNVVWGYVGDHAGRRQVVLGAAACTGLAALLALATRGTAWGVAGYAGVFALTGLATGGIQLASFTVVVDLAPAELRPTYVGLGNITQAPFAFGAPLLAALLADRGGYPPVFAVAAGLALGGLLLVRQGVHDPHGRPGSRQLPAVLAPVTQRDGSTIGDGDA
jgi:MFS family permease